MGPFLTDATPKPSKKRGRPQLSEEEKAARATLMLQHRIIGRSVSEIAEDFRVSVTTVQRATTPEARQLYLDAAKDAMLGLVEKAVKVYDTALDCQDADIATKVLENAGLLTKAANTLRVDTSGGDADIEYEAWRARIVARRQGAQSEQPLHGAPEGSDGRAPHPTPRLPALDAAPSGQSDGAEGAARGDLRGQPDLMPTLCGYCGTELLEGQGCPICQR